MLNYHELTITEPRGSPAKRKQFIVICCVMGFVLGNTLINAGAFNSVRISEGKFAGGEFVHKSLERDYVAFVGLARTVGSDAGVTEADQDGVIYSVLLDVDSSAGVPGGSERFMTGVLNGGEATTKELLALNDNMNPIGPMPSLAITTRVTNLVRTFHTRPVLCHPLTRVFANSFTQVDSCRLSFTSTKYFRH